MTSSIARSTERVDIWTALAAPLPASAINWRQQGKPTSRDGKHFARFVAYIDSQFVQERFDSVVPGEWDTHLDQLPNVVTFDGEDDKEPYAFKCRVQVLGVVREDVGQGRDYKTAATDAFKRAAVRFGIGRELYAYEQNWVQMDSDGKYAKPIEDPAVAYARRYGRPNGPKAVADGAADLGVTNAALRESAPIAQRGEQASGSDEISHSAQATDNPLCPKCDGRMWDNRRDKRNPRAPDFKCRDRSCDGVIWPPKDGAKGKPGRESEDGPHQRDETEEIPF